MCCHAMIACGWWRMWLDLWPVKGKYYTWLRTGPNSNNHLIEK
jgi:hypothetical protein